jgi:phenylpropionate dioxygenase-like ring-hydroxylating dioxygenase large terminal subunit
MQEHPMTEPCAALSHDKTPRALPAWTYRNAELNELEYEALFHPSWQFACHVNQVRNPGDYFTLDLMRDSVLVVRGKDGELRAFMNVCRHRGAKLLDGAGHCKARLTCPYHGWSYNLRGELAGMPAEKTFPGADKKTLGLRPIELEILTGLVFVRIVPGGPTLHEMWKDYIHLLEPYRLEEMVPLEEAWVEDWNCNWKVGVDNNLENYHVPVGHPGYDRMLDNDLGGFMNRYGVAGSKSTLRDKLSSNWSERRYQQMAPSLNEDLPPEIRTSWMFFTMPPNIGIDIYGDSMDVFQFLPLGAETCKVRYPIFVRPDSRREMKVLRYLNARINRQVSAEDKELSERVQIGLNSHGFEFGPLSTYEHCIHDFHDRVREACPVTSLPQAPQAGALRRINAEMLRGKSAAEATAA